MARYELVFRRNGVETVELRNGTTSDTPHVGGVLLEDGAVFTYRGEEWVAIRDDRDDLIRYVCTPVTRDGAAVE